LAILNTRKKKSNFHNNILELKVDLESKLILIQQLNERKLDEINGHLEYIIYSFSTAIRPNVYGS